MQATVTVPKSQFQVCYHIFQYATTQNVMHDLFYLQNKSTSLEASERGLKEKERVRTAMKYIYYIQSMTAHHQCAICEEAKTNK